MPFNPSSADVFRRAHPLPWTLACEPVSEAERLEDARALQAFVEGIRPPADAPGVDPSAEHDLELSYAVSDAHKYVVRDANGAAIATDTLFSEALTNALYRSVTGEDVIPNPVHRGAGPNAAAYHLLSAVALLFTVGSMSHIAERFPDRLRRHVNDLENAMRTFPAD